MAISTDSGSVYSTIFRYSPTPSLVLDTESLIVRDVNESMERLGYSRVELLGTRLQELCSGVLAIDEDLGGEHFDNSESRSGTWIFFLPDGTHRELNVAYRTVRLPSSERITMIFLSGESGQRQTAHTNGKVEAWG